jgi:RNA polymerase sigma factor (sigma-70 family)
MNAIAKACEHGFEAEYVGLFVLAQRAAQRVVGSVDQAEDLAAETLARTLASWSRVHSYAEPFVIRVATNLALDEVRKRKRRWDLDQLPRPQSVSAPQEDVVPRLVLVAALGRLSARQRQVLVLRYVIGLNEQEVADVLRIDAGTVKVHTRRGLASLRRRYGVIPEEVTSAASATS